MLASNASSLSGLSPSNDTISLNPETLQFLMKRTTETGV
ncbi:hypothetical protein M132_2692 [Bacteroides fragilis str. S24L15]|uniref:Uncharacterized protein n=1 Tax=Bacteroides fragilis str. 3976T8 TaxID=1339314 RepID=A0A016AMK7_BACFG|nr:hypothetical protein M123_2961 [Bacteroides fragilis str. 3976T8]EYA70674.1 hypothetical protein M132_2692 [Bacteroides fragilis str. S24L15]EYA75185.1 hypothetical protein M133_2776 [Bacteroides fragilis str. S24L26]OCR35210.1 hypothetical protein AC141_29830 [Bacteroides fragilis]